MRCACYPENVLTRVLTKQDPSSIIVTCMYTSAGGEIQAIERSVRRWRA